MSGGDAHTLAEAEALANGIVAELAPHCSRIQIAGSVRRKNPWVNDIEIVAIPDFSTGSTISTVDLFGNEVFHRPRAGAEFLAAVRRAFAPLTDVNPKSRYVKGIRAGMQVDLFLATENNWGYILAIRTGSADFTHRLAQRWSQMGYHGKDGMLHRANGEAVPLKEEVDLFALLGMAMPPPEMRIAQLSPWIR